jgi:hypothetical protein
MGDGILLKARHFNTRTKMQGGALVIVSLVEIQLLSRSRILTALYQHHDFVNIAPGRGGNEIGRSIPGSRQRSLIAQVLNDGSVSVTVSVIERTTTPTIRSIHA